MESTTQKRISSIDYIKCIAILCVVTYHSTLYDWDFLSGGSIVKIRYGFRTIFSAGVPLFFIVNGFLLFRQSYNTRKHMIRTVRLLALTMAMSFFQAVIFAVLDGIQLNITQIVFKVVCMDMDWGLNRFWFFHALISIYLIFPALKQLYDNDEQMFNVFTVIIMFFAFGLPALKQMVIFSGKNDLQTVADYFSSYNPFNIAFAYAYFCVGGSGQKENMYICRA